MSISIETADYGGAMKDPRIEKLADMLVNYSVSVQPDEKVEIRSSTQSEPLLREVYKQVLIAGGHPLIQSHPGQHHRNVLQICIR